MPANLGTESVTVQHPLTRHARDAGWTIVPQEQATTYRRGESGLFFYDLLKQKLQDLNPGVVTPELADEVIRKLESVRNNMEGNSEILAWLRGERSLYIESEKRTRNIALINFTDAAKNDFHVTEEWQYTNGNHTNRADDVFLINGIPIAVVECKTTANFSKRSCVLTFLITNPSNRIKFSFRWLRRADALICAPLLDAALPRKSATFAVWPFSRTF